MPPVTPPFASSPRQAQREGRNAARVGVSAARRANQPDEGGKSTMAIAVTSGADAHRSHDGAPGVGARGSAPRIAHRSQRREHELAPGTRGLTRKVTGADETLATTSYAGRRPVDREVRRHRAF